MNLLGPSIIWRDFAQNDLGSRMGYAARRLSHSINPIADASSKPSACTIQYRYPSPSKRFGTFGSGPLFFRRKSPISGQKTAGIQGFNAKDSHAGLNLLCQPSITTTDGGIKQCRSNAWPSRPYLSRHLQVVWTTMSNAQALAPLPALSSRMLQAAVCWLARPSGRAQARCATTWAFVNNATHKPNILIPKSTTVGAPLRWFFVPDKCAA